MMFNFKIKLPTSVEEYDFLIDRLAKKYKFEDKNHVAAVVSVAIRHLDNQTAYTTLDYLAQCVQKQMANMVASHKGDLIKHTVQVDSLIAYLKQNPNDAQAMDQLTKYASDGFQYAKEALAKLEAAAQPKQNLSMVPPILSSVPAAPTNESPVEPPNAS